MKGVCWKCFWQSHKRTITPQWRSLEPKNHKKSYKGPKMRFMHCFTTYHYREGMKCYQFLSQVCWLIISDRKYFNWFNQNSMHFRFEIAIFILIFLNMVTMGIEHYNQSRAFTFTLEITNALFVTIFALGKLVGHLILTVHISKLYLF